MLVEIWSDIACPWCHIGKRRFETALAAFEHRDEVEVVWRSFELDPGAPLQREGDRATRLARKYGITREKAVEMQDAMTQVAADEGITFRFDIARDTNTFDAHRIVHLAAVHGLQDAVKERLFRAHLGDGELIGDHAVLTRLAVEAGLPEAEVRATLAGDRFAADVRRDEETAAALGITAVPFFAVDRAVGAPGAQPPEILLEFLRRARAREDRLAAVPDGEACGPDGC